MAFHRIRHKILRLFTKHNKISSDLQFNTICEKLGYHFKDPAKLRQALKHRSYLIKTGEARCASNERLELLGDAVLGLVVTEHLYHHFPRETEGILTNYKSLLVSGRLLTDVAGELELGQFILLNESEARSGGRKRTSILSDAVEALIGAIYLDGGIEEAQKFIRHNITNRLNSILNDSRLRNNKSLLQEHCQSLSLDGPFYIVDDESGPDHKKMFTVSVAIEGQIVGTGKGPSKKKAEQNAANEALHYLKIL